jgi:hypothetical protein
MCDQWDGAIENVKVWDRALPVVRISEILVLVDWFVLMRSRLRLKGRLICCIARRLEDGVKHDIREVLV